MKTSPRPASARVSWWFETSSIKTPFPGRVSIPSSFVSLFIFCILSYLPSKTMGCFSGRLMSSASDQKLFCELCSPFNCSFDEFVGENVVSPSYSSILTPPLITVIFQVRLLPSHRVWKAGSYLQVVLEKTVNSFSTKPNSFGSHEFSQAPLYGHY